MTNGIDAMARMSLQPDGGRRLYNLTKGGLLLGTPIHGALTVVFFEASLLADLAVSLESPYCSASSVLIVVDYLCGAMV